MTLHPHAARWRRSLLPAARRRWRAHLPMELHRQRQPAIPTPNAVSGQWTVDVTTLRALDKCMDVAGTGNGALARLWTCNGSGAQNWTAGANGGSSTNGIQLIIWTCHGGTNQRWTLP